MPDEIMPEAMETALRLSRETTLFDDYRGTLTIGDIARIIQSTTRLKELREIAEEMAKGLAAVRALIANSHGVSGLHLNGDDAHWGSLLTGGYYEAWLAEFETAERAAARLAALRKEG